jgi:hypothetical protein
MRAGHHEPNLAILYDQVIAELKRGETAVFFVPLDTAGIDQTDQPEWWKNCTLTRIISAHGMEQAAAVKRAILQLGLQIDFVVSSELCSALSTYTFVLGNNRLHRFFIIPDLNPLEVRPRSALNDSIAEAQLRSHIQNLWVDSVKFLFGSPLPLSAAPHPVIADLSPGESAIFKAPRDAELVLVARLNWRQWEEMGNYFVAKRGTPPKTAKKVITSQKAQSDERTQPALQPMR